MTALMTVGHFLFFIVMAAAINERFHFAHLAFPLATGLFAFGGYPVWTQKIRKLRLPIPRMHQMLQIFFAGVILYVAATDLAHIVFAANVSAHAKHFCMDREAGFLCGPGGVSGPWLKFLLATGSLLSAVAITTAGMFILRYVFVYLVFLEWSWVRHHGGEPGDEALAMYKPMIKFGSFLVRWGVKAKQKLLYYCCYAELAEHDSEAEHGTGAYEAPEEQLSVSSDLESGRDADEQEEEEESGWASSSTHSSGDEIVTACLVTCCCSMACCALIGCIVLSGAARQISCLLFYIIVESA